MRQTTPARQCFLHHPVPFLPVSSASHHPRYPFSRRRTTFYPGLSVMRQIIFSFQGQQSAVSNKITDDRGQPPEDGLLITDNVYHILSRIRSEFISVFPHDLLSSPIAFASDLPLWADITDTGRQRYSLPLGALFLQGHHVFSCRE